MRRNLAILMGVVLALAASRCEAQPVTTEAQFEAMRWPTRTMREILPERLAKLDATLHAPVANVTALAAIPATDRAPGMLVGVLAGADTKAHGYIFHSTSTTQADADLVVAPAAGTGRWLRLDQADADTTYTAGSGLTLTETEFSLPLTCSAGNFLAWAVDGETAAWECTAQYSTDPAGGIVNTSGVLTLPTICTDNQILEYSTLGGWSCLATPTGGSPYWLDPANAAFDELPIAPSEGYRVLNLIESDPNHSKLGVSVSGEWVWTDPSVGWTVRVTIPTSEDPLDRIATYTSGGWKALGDGDDETIEINTNGDLAVIGLPQRVVAVQHLNDGSPIAVSTSSGYVGLPFVIGFDLVGLSGGNQDPQDTEIFAAGLFPREAILVSAVGQETNGGPFTVTLYDEAGGPGGTGNVLALVTDAGQSVPLSRIEVAPTKGLYAYTSSDEVNVRLALTFLPLEPEAAPDPIPDQGPGEDQGPPPADE